MGSIDFMIKTLTLIFGLLFFFSSRRRHTRFDCDWSSDVCSSDLEQLDGAIKLAEKQNRSHVARVVGEALSEVKPLLRDRATITAADINSVERAVEREILIVAAELKRGLGILATTGSTAPFVGLLCTVMGIVNAFTGMAASGGGGSLASVSAGIAEALIDRKSVG